MIRRNLLTLIVTFGIGLTPLHAQEKFLGKTVTEWTAQLKSNNSKDRRSAAFALGKQGSRASVAVAALKDAYAAEKDAKVREAIVFALGDICRDSALVKSNAGLEPLFLGAVKDTDAYVRRSGAYALGCLASKSDATKAALEAAVGDNEAMVRQNAIFAMAQFNEDALPAIKKALADTDSLVKRDAASLMVPPTMTDGDKVHDLLPDLLPLCRDNNSETQRAALNVLVQIVDTADKSAIPALRWVLDSRDLDNKRTAAAALAKIGGPQTEVAVPILLDVAKSSTDADQRREAILLIRRIGPKAGDAVPELIRFLRTDKEAKVREAAALALAGLGISAEPAVNALVEKVGDKNDAKEVRMESAMALSKIGSTPTTKAVIPALVDIIADTAHDAKVREKVWWALKIHGGNLNKEKGCFEAFSKVCKETPSPANKMLRYNCAYLLGMVWQAQAPLETLDVLSQFLKDDEIRLFKGVDDKGGGLKSDEGKEIDKAKIKLRGEGDARVMACDALKYMGPGLYARRNDIMNQLRALAADAKGYPLLRTKASELLKDAQ
jgi:HEAT repeat protein